MNQKRSILACILGNVIEWYEFTLFAQLAPVIAELFFPTHSKIVGLLSTLSVFALGFVIRPLGSILLGQMGDQFGRAKALKFTMLMLSICSVMIGLLPTYAQVGIWSPILLILCRLLQGLCIGGEFAGAMIYLTESAPNHQRALFSAMTNNGSNIGVLIAASVCTFATAYFSHHDFITYGWRILFMLGGVLGVIGLYIRRDINETQVFQQLQQQITAKYHPIKLAFSEHKATMVKVALLLFVSACGSYTIMNYTSIYLHTFLRVPLTQAYHVQAMLIFLSLLLVPVFAYLSDRFGRRPLLIFATVGYILFALPVYELMQTVQSWWVLLPFILFYSAEQAVIPVTMVEMFPGKSRYTGMSFAYNVTMALIGGNSPLINTYFIHYFHNNLFIAYFVMGCAAVSLGVVLMSLPKRYGQQLDLAIA